MSAVGWTVRRSERKPFQPSNLLECPASQNQERAGLVALRARDRAELQVGEAVDIAALHRERARPAEARAPAAHRRVAGGRPVSAAARRRAGAAAQPEGALQARAALGRW